MITRISRCSLRKKEIDLRSFLVTLMLLCAFGLQAQPSVSLQRQKSIDETKLSLQDELKAHAGSWNEWFDMLAPCRKELSDAAAAAEKEQHRASGDYSILESTGKPALYVPTHTLHYLITATPADTWAATRPSVPVVLAFNAWLKRNGVDLILVPAPKVVEVYPDRFLKSAPADRIIAPQTRKLIFDLLQADVEVIDLLPIFLAEAHKPGELIHLPTDTHWSNRAQQIAAGEIAKRLARYTLVRQAAAKPARYRTQDITVPFKGNQFDHLDPQQAELAANSTIPVTVVSNKSTGKPFADTEQSPVVVIGDSYTHYYGNSVTPGSGIDALLAKRINLPIWNISSGAATTQPLKEFIRDPTLLSTHTVVVWIITDDLLTNPDPNLWQTLPFPGPH